MSGTGLPSSYQAFWASSKRIVSIDLLRFQHSISTHAVSLTAWPLRNFLRLLRDDKVAAVKTGPARYADLRRDLPFVAEIKTALKAETGFSESKQVRLSFSSFARIASVKNSSKEE